ncbi:glycosyltransferase family 87 protein [Micromonospora pattaloongensis]|uniref:glycosyltransferase family 87 protein n=1 Tax=Micromonospora pattaloongensis TaxID=405436 RepID=UPI001FDEDB16|nr:glycosyltransferase family 87 protein [Micromonospora pattaloongensis]
MGAARARTGRQVATVAVLALVAAGLLVVLARRNHFFDLRVYYGALSHWVRDGGEIYDYLKAYTPYGFTYPPFAALLMLPMALIPLGGAQVISVTLTVVTTGLVLWWLVAPIARRQGWTPWFAVAVAACLAAVFEPLRETVSFGQVNTLLLFLVAADLLRLVARGSRWAGVGVGLATAIKLTPGIFLIYLLVTRRWRAAVTATATAAAATLLAAAVAPDATREFWFSALPNTDRVGVLAFISNQSLQGMLERLGAPALTEPLWPLLVCVVLAIWLWRLRAVPPALVAAVTRRRRAPRRPVDAATGLALTGIVGGLVSPVTWVHHLVWLLPALLLTADRAFAAPAGSPERRRRLASLAVAYAVLSSGIVWIWEHNSKGPVGFVGSSAYVWVSLALLVAMPVRERDPSGGAEGAGVAELGERQRRLSGAEGQVVDATLPVGR